MSESPRYLTIRINNGESVTRVLAQAMRPGDKVASVYPVAVLNPDVIGASNPYYNVILEALIELRHPSWERDGKGWVAAGDGG